MADRRYTINAFTVTMQSSEHSYASEAAYDSLLTQLSEEDVKATFFIKPSWFRGNRSSLRHFLALGHDVGLLISNLQPLPTITSETTAFFRAQKELLENTLGRPVIGCRINREGFARPISSTAYEALIQAGFTYSSSQYPPRNLRIGIQNSKRKAWSVRTKSGDLWELPLSTWRPLGIGILSVRSAHPEHYPAWTIARNIEGMNRHGEPAMLAFRVHSSSTNNAGTYESLRQIFRTYRFSTVTDAFASRLTRTFEQQSQSIHRRTGIIRCDARTALPFL